MNLLVIASALLVHGGGDEPIKIGDPAPAIVAEAWVNLDGQVEPSLKSLRGKVAVVEFWGTWCGPCVRSMPHVQELHERYGKRGVVVLAISNEPVATIRPFLERHRYSMIAGADPDLRSVEAYQVKGWPTTFLIDKEGRLAWRGNPTSVEAALDKLLGLPSRPAALLDAYVAAKTGDLEASRMENLERLVRKAPFEFDLKAWAEKHQPATTDKTPLPVVEPGDALERYASGDAEAARAIARSDATAFNLARWARQTLGRRYPVQTEELRGMLTERRYPDALDALADRNPSVECLASARADAKFVEFCRFHAKEHLELARKGLLAQGWVLVDGTPHDPKAFNDLAINAITYAAPVPMTKDGKVDHRKARLGGVSFSGEIIMKAEFATFTEFHIYQYCAMKAVAGKEEVSQETLRNRVAEVREAILKDLRAKYGPEPKQPK